MKISTTFDITETAKKVLDNNTFTMLMNKSGSVIVNSLLTDNTKLAKGDNLNYGLFMLPHNVINNYLKSDYAISTLCPMATKNHCHKICIGEFSGHYAMKKGPAHSAQIKRTIAFLFLTETFYKHLVVEAAILGGVALASNTTVFIRPNGFSDSTKLTVKLATMLKAYNPKLLEHIQIYDYTKNRPNYSAIVSNAITLALSISKATMTDAAYTNSDIDYIVKNGVKFSAIVTDDKEQLLNNTSFDNVHFIDGDLFDTFPVYAKETTKKHIVLLLTVKGIRLSTKALTRQIFAVTEKETIGFYSILNSTMDNQNNLIAKAA